MDYLFIVIIVAAAFLFGKAYGKYQIVQRMIDELTDKEIADLENLMSLNEVKLAGESTTRLVKQEIVDGSVYLYGANGVFICQGANAEQAAERFGSIDSGTVTVQCSHGSDYRIHAGKISTSAQPIVL